jgi:hypothetical protein
LLPVPELDELDVLDEGDVPQAMKKVIAASGIARAMNLSKRSIVSPERFQD